MFEEINERRRAVEENILKSFGEDLDIEKARSGIYADTPENRKLGRVGQRYGNPKKEEEPAKKRMKKQEEPTKKRVKNEEPKEVKTKEQEESGSEKKNVDEYARKTPTNTLKKVAANKNAPENLKESAKKELKGRNENMDDSKPVSVKDLLKQIKNTRKKYERLSPNEVLKELGINAKVRKSENGSMVNQIYIDEQGFTLPILKFILSLKDSEPSSVDIQKNDVSDTIEINGRKKKYSITNLRITLHGNACKALTGGKKDDDMIIYTEMNKTDGYVMYLNHPVSGTKYLKIVDSFW